MYAALLAPIFLGGLSGCGAGGGERQGAAPKPLPPKVGVVIEMARGTEPRERVRLRATGAEVGPIDGRPSLRFYSVPALADDLWYFRRTYAPFHLQQGDLDLSFNGEGAAPATPAERRLILEWARAAAAEVVDDAEVRSYGLVLSAHGEGGSLPCDEVAVALSGAVWAEPCPWGGEERARLEPSALPRLYGWFDALAPFQITPGEAGQGGDGGEALRLVFAGRGTRTATAAEKGEIRSFVEQLSRELRVRRPLGAGSVDAPPAGTPLLLPTDLASGGHPTARILDLPKEVPAFAGGVAPRSSASGEPPAAAAAPGAAGG